MTCKYIDNSRQYRIDMSGNHQKRISVSTKSTNLFVRRSSVLVPIFLTSYIAVSMSVLKFKRYTETLEELTKISEKLVFVVCRLRRVVEDSHMCKNIEELNQVKLTLQQRTL